MNRLFIFKQAMQTNFQHPEDIHMTDPIEFAVVMLKRELMQDILLLTRMNNLEAKWQRYEKIMKSLYTHEDDWAPFDDHDDYYLLS
jgi:hypothetical protein